MWPEVLPAMGIIVGCIVATGMGLRFLDRLEYGGKVGAICALIMPGKRTAVVVMKQVETLHTAFVRFYPPLHIALPPSLSSLPVAR